MRWRLSAFGARATRDWPSACTRSSASSTCGSSAPTPTCWRARGLVRLFPLEIVGTVMSLGELHALSEQFDTAMGAVIDGPAIDDSQYAEAWRRVGRPADRERQIMLMMAVGSALDRYTRNPLLRTSLRLMRGPASAAGLGVLQAFLERGFDTFRDMRGAQEFLATVTRRERELAARLFAGGTALDPARTR